MKKFIHGGHGGHGSLGVRRNVFWLRERKKSLKEIFVEMLLRKKSIIGFKRI